MRSFGLFYAVLLFNCVCRRAVEVDVTGEVTGSSSLLDACSHFDLQQETYRQPGQHLICAVPDPEGGLLINVIVDSLLVSNDSRSNGINLRFGTDHGDVRRLFDFLYKEIGTSNKRKVEKWRLYTAMGEPIESIDSLVYLVDGVIYTNGNFIWPGVGIGHKRSTEGGYSMETLSLKPLVLRVENFLTHEECDYIRLESEQHMQASGTSKMDHDVDKPDTTWRTSTQYFLPSEGRPIVQAIDKRTAELTRTEVNQQEYVQVLRYLEGQKYDQHHDYFDARFYQKDLATLRNIKHGEKNRLATVLWYLSTVDSGGHTIFPLANSNKLGPNHDFEDCSFANALLVQPVKGEVIIFYSLAADGSLDSTSLHGACKVGAGLQQKWAANKWVWNEDAGFLS